MARKAESDIKSVAAALPRHQQIMEGLKQQVDIIKGKMKAAKAKAAQAISTVQVAVEAMLEHNK